jgi:hypothetical protein
MKNAHAFALEARDAGDATVAERVLRDRLAEEIVRFGVGSVEACRTRFLIAMLGPADADALLDAAHPVGWDRGGVSMQELLTYCQSAKPRSAERALVDGLVKAWGMGDEFGIDADTYLEHLAKLHEAAGRTDAAARCRARAKLA